MWRYIFFTKKSKKGKYNEDNDKIATHMKNWDECEKLLLQYVKWKGTKKSNVHFLVPQKWRPSLVVGPGEQLFINFKTWIGISIINVVGKSLIFERGFLPA